MNISMWSFWIIGLGGLACVMAGLLSFAHGAKKIAVIALASSGVSCLLLPFTMSFSLPAFLTFLIFWGLVVIADSPLFSTLVAQNAAPKIKGTALTLVNSVGFAITIISIQLIGWMYAYFNHTLVFVLLALGPMFGLFHLRKRSSNA